MAPAATTKTSADMVALEPDATVKAAPQKREAPQQREIHPQVALQQREAPPEVAQPIRKAVADDVVLTNARHLVLADPDLNA